MSYQKYDSANLSVRIYLRNNRANLHTNPIWNDGALGFIK